MAASQLLARRPARRRMVKGGMTAKGLAAVAGLCAVVAARAFVCAGWGRSLDREQALRRLTGRAQQEERPGHAVNTKGPPIDPEELAIQQRVKEHQESAPKLDGATEVRTLVQYNHGFAVISTNSITLEGYPGGSVVGFAPDEQGRPLFSFSSMSTHTQDLLKDSRCSLTVASKEFKSAADGRVNLIGDAVPITDEDEKKAARALYLQKHPKAFWIDFGDFTWFRMDVKYVRFVGGFARAGSCTSEEYVGAKPDPIAAFSGTMAGHMNDDHRASTIAIIRKYVGIDVEDAEITSMDSLGMYVKVSRTPRAAGQMMQWKLRLPWIRPITERKDAKAVIVEMSQASAEFVPSEKK